MYKIRRGSLLPNEPKLIWVKILMCPRFSEDQISLCKKFNAILEETIHKKKANNILDPNDAVNCNHFDLSDKLTPTGKSVYWKDIDEQLRKFDDQEIDLKPRAVVSGFPDHPSK